MKKQAYTNWLESTLGQYILQHEQALYDASVSNIFGFHAIQVGLPEVKLLKDCRITHQLQINQSSGNLLCDPEYLPFAESSIDLLCLPHSLEFSGNPHQSLREAARVLVPEGYLLMTGFNPLSTWCLKRLFRFKKSDESLYTQHYPWNGHFFSVSRIKDWLALLGLELIEVQYFGYELPFNDEMWLKRFAFTEKLGQRCWPTLGAVYFIVAKKRVVNMHLLKPGWKNNILQQKLVVSSSKKSKQSSKLKINHDD
jgi:SAM-dependent methyltransferase